MKNKLKNKAVVVYTRVSTKDQKDFGNSLTVQTNRIVDFCKSHEMNVLKVFSEDYSAKDFNRPAYKALKEYVKSNKVDYVLVQKWDRFSRNVGRALLVIEQFKKLGVEVNCVENWIEYDAPDHIVLLSLFLSTPEAENSKISERSQAGTRQALKEGRYVKSHP
jgi:DNA invertase Pin-like site-specific DNA recombinase